ncbi:MAG: ABC transporter ATP-binding protein [Gammaproteobacteria bacterium]
MARVDLDKVNKVYGAGSTAVHAVRDLSLSVEDGEFVALLGPSGCGKTSSLRMIVGLEDITGGDIRFDGERVNERSPEQRNVAMAFETYALYPNFTVGQNLAFPLEVRGVPEGERRTQVQRIAELLRIENILDQTPGALSGGQQQRVGLGRALIRDPAVFILDEVLSHIDAHLKFQMLFDLKRIHQELRRTTLYVTHDQVEALALADRVAVMSNALLQQVGDRDTLYHRPVNVFVADFIGEPPTNFFEAELVEDRGHAQLKSRHSSLRFNVDGEHAQRLVAHGAVHFTVGVRPQNLHLSLEDTALAAGALEGEVVIDEYLGEQTILTLRNGSDEFRALAPPDTFLDKGANARLLYAGADVMVFDRQTEALVA